MSKQMRSRGLRLVILSLAIIFTVSMSGSTGYPLVSADGQSAGPSAGARQTINLRRPRVKITGWINGTSTDYWRVGDRVLRIGSNALIEGDVGAGSYAVVIASVESDGQLHAQSLSLRPPSAGIGYTVEFRCLIQEINERYWIVCNRVVLITENSSIHGRPEVGALAEVKGVRMSGDAVLARNIRVVLASAYAEVEFEGAIESLDDDAWTVTGITVTISPVTVIRGVPEPGLAAEVKGTLQPDGSVLAQLITVKGAGLTSQVDIQGLVERIEATTWVVAGTQISLGPSTFIDDSRAPAEVGMWAQVRALRRQGNSLLALRILLSRPN